MDYDVEYCITIYRREISLLILINIYKGYIAIRVHKSCQSKVEGNQCLY